MRSITGRLDGTFLLPPKNERVQLGSSCVTSRKVMRGVAGLICFLYLHANRARFRSFDTSRYIRVRISPSFIHSDCVASWVAGSCYKEGRSSGTYSLLGQTSDMLHIFCLATLPYLLILDVCASISTSLQACLLHHSIVCSSDWLANIYR